MLIKKEREEVVAFGRKMLSARLTTGSGGNLSIVDRNSGRIAITPSGVDYIDLIPEDIAVIDMEGNHVEGKWEASSESAFHLALYKMREEVNAVVHTHSPYATTFACLREEIPAVHYLVGFAGKNVPIAPYATFGTESLAKNIIDNIGENNAVLLASHGLVAVGTDLNSAFTTAEETEFTARIYWQTRAVGNPVILPDDEMEKIVKKFKTYGKSNRLNG